MKTSHEFKPPSTTSLAICESAWKYTYKPIRTPLIPRGWVHHPLSPSVLPPFLAPPSRIDIEFLERFTGTPRSPCFLHFQFRRAMYPQSVRDPSRQNRTRLEHVCRYESADPFCGNSRFPYRIEHHHGSDMSFEWLSVGFTREPLESTVNRDRFDYATIAAEIARKLLQDPNYANPYYYISILRYQMNLRKINRNG